MRFFEYEASLTFCWRSSAAMQARDLDLYRKRRPGDPKLVIVNVEAENDLVAVGNGDFETHQPNRTGDRLSHEFPGAGRTAT